MTIFFMSVCRDLKTEYDALKTLNNEFVLACEKAGDPRALSADQLRALQILQRALEQKRDEFVEKTANARWKKVWKELMLMEIDVADHKERVDEILSGVDFQNKAMESFIAIAQKSLTPPFSGSFESMGAIIGKHAATKFGHLLVPHIRRMQTMIDFEEFIKVVNNSLESEIKKDPSEVEIVVMIARGAYAAFGEYYISEERRSVVRDWLERESTRRCIFEHIKHDAEIGQNSSGARAMDAVIDFHVALSLELLKDREIEHIQKLMRDKKFLEHLNEGIISYIQTELVGDGETAAFVLQTVNAMKALTMLRRPEKK